MSNGLTFGHSHLTNCSCIRQGNPVARFNDIGTDKLIGKVAMPIDVREETRKKCEELGVNLVRAKLYAGDFGTESTHAREWLEEEDDKVRKQREADERERAERVASSAEGSARASQNAANAAKKAAFWTKIAAIGTLASAIATWYPALNRPLLPQSTALHEASMPTANQIQSSAPSSEHPIPANINEILDKIKAPGPQGNQEDILKYKDIVETESDDRKLMWVIELAETRQTLAWVRGDDEVMKEWAAVRDLAKMKLQTLIEK